MKPMRLHHVGIVLPTLQKPMNSCRITALKSTMPVMSTPIRPTSSSRNSVTVQARLKRPSRTPGSLPNSTAAAAVSPTLPLKSTTSKVSVQKWKLSARAACWSRKPFKERTTSSSTSAALRPIRVSSSNTSRRRHPLRAAAKILS